MNILGKCSPNQWMSFINIEDDAAPSHIEEGKDLFVGKNKCVVLKLKNGTITRVRDIVVLGKLIIKSTDTNKNVKPKLVARDLFNAGLLRIYNIDIKNRYFGNMKNREQFTNDLHHLFLSWHFYQKEIESKMGLKSVLF